MLERGSCQHYAQTALQPRKTRYPLYRRLGGYQSRSARVQKISPAVGFDPIVQPAASRYMTKLSQLKWYAYPKIMLPNSSIGSGLYIYYRRVLLPRSLNFMAICWWIVVAIWLYLPRNVDSGIKKKILLLLHKIVHVLTYLLQLCLSKFGSNQHSKLPGHPILSMLTKLLPVQFVSSLPVLYQLQHMSEA